MNIVEKILREKTSNMFTDGFYSSVSVSILSEIKKDVNKKGYVYFIKNGVKSNMVKIGFSFDLDKRLSSYKTSFSEKVFLIGYIESEQYINIEKEIHSYFSEKRKKGEWFELNSFDFLEIKNMYDFESVNNFYDKDFKSLNKKEDVLLYSNYIKFVDELKKNEYYNVSDLMIDFNKKFNENQTSPSWFGRELNKAIISLGLFKKSKNQNGVRYFTIY